MARIAGVDIPNDKRGEISLTYIYGIGRNRSREILKKIGIDFINTNNYWRLFLQKEATNREKQNICKNRNVTIGTIFFLKCNSSKLN